MKFQLPKSVGRERAETRSSETLEEFPRYRIDVIAPNVAEAVTSLGGWVFDMAMAGWDVRILIAGDTVDVNDRPLRILGARTVEVNAQLSTSHGVPDILAVYGQLLVDGSHVHDHVMAALDTRGTEVMTWGRAWPGLPGLFDVKEHRLSGAAHVFKAEALTAAGVPLTPGEHVESFWGYPSVVPQSSTWLTAPAESPLLATGSDPFTTRRRAAR
jgi:hypothetical protein